MDEHKEIHNETQASNDGVTKNYIDRVLINASRSSLDVRSLRGRDGDSDHLLVKAMVRTRLASQ